MKVIPAFPQHDAIANEFHPSYGKDRGMTLRDYFAAKAMQGFVCADTDFNLPPDVIARDAYDLADAMLKARQA